MNILSNIQITNNNLEKLNKNFNQTKNRFNILTSYLTDILTVVIKLEEIKNQIFELDTIVTTILSAFDIVSIIPKIKLKIENLISAVKKLKNIVHLQKNYFEIIFEKYIKTISSDTYQLIIDTNHTFNNINIFNDSLIDSANIISVIEPIDHALDNISQIIGVVEMEIITVEKKLNFLGNVGNEINKILNQASDILKITNQLQKILNYNITIYLNRNLKNEIKQNINWKLFWNSQQELTFTVEQILTRSDSIPFVVIDELDTTANKMIDAIFDTNNLNIKIPATNNLDILGQHVLNFVQSINFNNVKTINDIFSYLLSEKINY